MGLVAVVPPLSVQPIQPVGVICRRGCTAAIRRSNTTGGQDLQEQLYRRYPYSQYNRMVHVGSVVPPLSVQSIQPDSSCRICCTAAICIQPIQPADGSYIGTVVSPQAVNYKSYFYSMVSLVGGMNFLFTSNCVTLCE